MSEKRGDIIEHAQASDTAAVGKPQWLKERLEWFMDLRFGLFIHWGPYSQWDCCESWPLVPADTWARPDEMKCWVERDRDLERFSRDYWNLNQTFNPTELDPGAWAELAQAAGMRYLTFTTKHHDGFCMFDTATTDYRVTHPDCPFHDSPRANIVREVFDTFRQKGLSISCYFSKSDWNCPFYWAPAWQVVDRNPNYDTQRHPEIWSQFVSFVHRQVEELMTGYGPIDVLWLDGGQVRPPNQDIKMTDLAAMARAHQPGLIFADRTVGGDYEDFITPEQQIPDEPPGSPWESCLTLGHHWKYVPGDEYKSPREVVHMLIEIAAKGGNLLLGIGPDPLGRIPPAADACLRKVGAWLETNGEAIYGTRPVPPYQSGRLRFTAKERYTYAVLLSSEGSEVSDRQVTIEGLRPEPGPGVTLLGHSGAVPWEPTDDGFRIELPEGVSDEYALVLGFVRRDV